MDNSVVFWNSETCDFDFAWLTSSLIPQELSSIGPISNRRKTKIVLKLSGFVIVVSFHPSNQANPPTTTKNPILMKTKFRFFLRFHDGLAWNLRKLRTLLSYSASLSHNANPSPLIPINHLSWQQLVVRKNPTIIGPTFRCASSCGPEMITHSVTNFWVFSVKVNGHCVNGHCVKMVQCKNSQCVKWSLCKSDEYVTQTKVQSAQYTSQYSQAGCSQHLILTNR